MIDMISFALFVWCVSAGVAIVAGNKAAYQGRKQALLEAHKTEVYALISASTRANRFPNVTWICSQSTIDFDQVELALSALLQSGHIDLSFKNNEGTDVRYKVREADPKKELD